MHLLIDLFSRLTLQHHHRGGNKAEKKEMSDGQSPFEQAEDGRCRRDKRLIDRRAALVYPRLSRTGPRQLVGAVLLLACHACLWTCSDRQDYCLVLPVVDHGS